MKNLSYKKPILIEQFAELYLAKGTLSADKVIHFVPIIEKEGFSQIEMGTIDGISIGFGVGKPEEIKRLPQTPRVRCWNQEKNKLVQLFEDRIVVHQVGRYLGWSEFEGLFHNVFEKASSNIKNFLVESVAFQTIDQFEINSSDYILSKYINCTGAIIPRFYENVVDSADITLGKGLLNESLGQNRQIRVSVRKNLDKTIFNIQSVFHNILKSNDSTLKLLNQLHGESNSCFEEIAGQPPIVRNIFI